MGDRIVQIFASNRHQARSILFYLVVLCLASCASLAPEFDPPKVNLESFQRVADDGGIPRFEITLRVTNPNTKTLDIAGISYSIKLLDTELITGVANDIDPIPGYSEGIITLEAGLQLFQLLRLVGKLGQDSTQPLVYHLTAKIDFNGFVPTQRIDDKGEIALN